MAKFSTGLRNGMLATSSFKTLVDGGRLYLYAGTEPATADAAIGSATLLATLTESGDGTTGLTFGTASAGVISKAAAEVWSTTSITTGGVAAFWRLQASDDAGDASTSAVRVQGSIGGVDADMLLGNTTLVSGEPFSLSYFNVALPTY